MKIKSWILGAAAAAAVAFGSANTANAMSCRVVVTGTSGAVGAIAGFIVDLATVVTLGVGTSIGSVGAGTIGRVAAEYTCPDSHYEGAIEERSLKPVIERCLSKGWKPQNPFWDRRDFCTVPINPFVRGDDVSMIEGRQLDILDVVAQVKANFQEAANLPAAGDFAGDLRECVRSFDENWGRDECVVTPTRRTATYWGLRSGHPSRVDTVDVLRAILRATAHVS